MYCLCVNVYYCHRVTTQLQLTNRPISYITFQTQLQRFIVLAVLELSSGFCLKVAEYVQLPLRYIINIRKHHMQHRNLKIRVTIWRLRETFKVLLIVLRYTVHEFVHKNCHHFTKFGYNSNIIFSATRKLYLTSQC